MSDLSKDVLATPYMSLTCLPSHIQRVVDKRTFLHLEDKLLQTVVVPPGVTQQSASWHRNIISTVVVEHISGSLQKSWETDEQKLRTQNRSSITLRDSGVFIYIKTFATCGRRKFELTDRWKFQMGKLVPLPVDCMYLYLKKKLP